MDFCPHFGTLVDPFALKALNVQRSRTLRKRKRLDPVYMGISVRIPVHFWVYLRHQGKMHPNILEVQISNLRVSVELVISVPGETMGQK